MYVGALYTSYVCTYCTCCTRILYTSAYNTLISYILVHYILYIYYALAMRMCQMLQSYIYYCTTNPVCTYLLYCAVYPVLKHVLMHVHQQFTYIYTTYMTLVVKIANKVSKETSPRVDPHSCVVSPV